VHGRLQVSDVNELIGELLDGAAKARRTFPRGGFRGVDSTSLQVLLALAIDAQPASSVAELAERLALDPSTVSHVAGALRSEGLLESRPDHRDSRRRELSLTRRGLALADGFVRERARDD
jgi:DNA-binding MarR family transcriptional regulator